MKIQRDADWFFSLDDFALFRFASLILGFIRKTIAVGNFYFSRCTKCSINNCFFPSWKINLKNFLISNLSIYLTVPCNRLNRFKFVSFLKRFFTMRVFGSWSRSTVPLFDLSLKTFINFGSKNADFWSKTEKAIRQVFTALESSSRREPIKTPEGRKFIGRSKSFKMVLKLFQTFYRSLLKRTI